MGGLQVAVLAGLVLCHSLFLQRRDPPKVLYALVVDPLAIAATLWVVDAPVIVMVPALVSVVVNSVLLTRPETTWKVLAFGILAIATAMIPKHLAGPTRWSAAETVALVALSLSIFLPFVIRMLRQVASDLNERKLIHDRLLETEGRYRDLVENLPVGVFRTSPEGEWIEVNGAMVEMLEFPDRETMLGTPVIDIYPDARDRQEWRQLLEIEGLTPAVDRRWKTHTGKLIWIRESARVVRDTDGEVKWYEGIAQDVSDQRRAQAQLEELVLTKDKFLASVSHQLRTPLTSIVGFTQILKDEWDEFDPPGAKAFVEDLARQSLELSALVEDLLVAARTQTGTIEVRLEVLDAKEEVLSTVARVPMPSRKRVVTDDLRTVYVRADGHRLRQIVRNLVSNAARYGGDTITIHLEGQDDRAVFTVSDNGRGINRHQISEIFERYHEVNSIEGVPSSLGLGLAVSRSLARLMHGDLTYRRVNDETRFELWLPKGSPTPSPVVASEPDAAVMLATKT